jgi:CHAT domain-containing protein
MVTLVSACQLAGYRHVIGTLWPVGDKSAVEVATAFYGNGLPEAAGVRLHRAVSALRRRIPGRPQYWAPFIHSGV